MMRRVVSTKIAAPVAAVALARYCATNAGAKGVAELKAQVEAAEAEVRVLEHKVKQASSAATPEQPEAASSTASTSSPQGNLQEELAKLRTQMNDLKSQMASQGQTATFESFESMFRRAHEERAKAWNDTYNRQQSSGNTTTEGCQSGPCFWGRGCPSAFPAFGRVHVYQGYHPFSFLRFLFWTFVWVTFFKFLFACCFFSSCHGRSCYYTDADPVVVETYSYGPRRYTWSNWERENWGIKNQQKDNSTSTSVAVEERNDTKI